MKKYLIFLFFLLCVFNSNADGPRSSRKSNPNYKNLKVYVKVLERYGKSDFYLAQIDIVNTGNTSVSFREPIYGFTIFWFTAGGVKFVSEDERLYYEKKITAIPQRKAIDKKVRILANSKYTIKTQFYIKNRELFLRTNKNLRLEFHFNDANMGFMEDESRPKIISENVIDYKW